MIGLTVRPSNSLQLHILTEHTSYKLLTLTSLNLSNIQPRNKSDLVNNFSILSTYHDFLCDLIIYYLFNYLQRIINLSTFICIQFFAGI